MKVITELLGRVFLLVPIDEVYPKDGVYLPDVINYIGAKYTFATKTEALDEIRDKGAMFRMGKFRMAEGKEAVITDFSVPEEGLIVTAPNTDIAEAFLHDVVQTLAEVYDFRTDPITGKTFYVLSEMIVEFEDVVDRAIRSFDVISGRLSETFMNHYGVQEPQNRFEYRTTRLDFDFNRYAVPAPLANIAPFLVEKRANQPPHQNKYFCRAPFRTQDHIRLLEEFETLLKD